MAVMHRLESFADSGLCAIIRAQSLWRHIANIQCFQVSRFTKAMPFSRNPFSSRFALSCLVSCILQDRVLSQVSYEILKDLHQLRATSSL